MPIDAQPTARPRFDSLDGLRGLAAFGVLVLHVWMFHHGDAGRPPKGPLDLVMGELRLGVQFFFVLSGFLLWRAFGGAALDGAPQPGLARYAVRRAARVLPAYWAAVLGSFLLLRHLDHAMQAEPEQLPIFLLFAQNQVGATLKHLDPPMWTLAVEVSFYAALPLAGLAAARFGADRRRQLRLTAGIAVAGMLFGLLAYLQAWPETVSTSLPVHLTEFGAGMTVAVALHGRAMAGRRGLALGVAGAVLVGANSWWHAVGAGSFAVRSMVGDAPGIAGMALLVTALVGTACRIPVLERGPIRWLGTWSFGIYLAHFPVIFGLRATGNWPEQGLAAQLAVVGAISIALAAASWTLLERPAIAWARRATSPRAAPARRTPGVLRRWVFG